MAVACTWRLIAKCALETLGDSLLPITHNWGSELVMFRYTKVISIIFVSLNSISIFRYSYAYRRYAEGRC
jgi:hypothetical protein